MSRRQQENICVSLPRSISINRQIRKRKGNCGELLSRTPGGDIEVFKNALESVRKSVIKEALLIFKNPLSSSNRQIIFRSLKYFIDVKLVTVFLCYVSYLSERENRPKREYCCYLAGATKYSLSSIDRDQNCLRSLVSGDFHTAASFWSKACGYLLISMTNIPMCPIL